MNDELRSELLHELGKLNERLHVLGRVVDEIVRPANYAKMPWRVGRKVGRTIYAMPEDMPCDTDPLIGVMDTHELADIACLAHNDWVENDE
jgi:hypothetical protein